MDLYITGAGVSADSGIPTFRGEDGFWTIGSKNYTPQEMATRKMYLENPTEFLSWYYLRFAKYRNANKTWVDLDAVKDDKPNLGFIRPLFSTTAEHGAAPEGGGGGGGGSATRNLKIGSTTIDSIYLGSSQFTHVYVGSTLIWSQS